jgi:polyisoprenoid-binding protein YceI
MSSEILTQNAAQTWEIDPVHSSVQFTVRHMVISKVHGRFARFSGAIALDGDDRSRARVQVDIDTASIDTNEQQRDAHLKSGDFLDVEKYPTMTFVSERIENVDDERFRIVGKLTLHGVTRDVTLDAEDGGRARDPWGGERVGYTARTSLNRKDFGLAWNQVLETGGLLVGERIDIVLEIQAVRKV